MRRRLGLVLSILVLCGTRNAQAQCQILSATRIVDFSGDTVGYRLSRDGVRMRFGLYTPLRHRDRIEVLARAGAIALRTETGSVVWLRARQGPRCISRRGGRSVVGNLIEQIGEMATQRQMTAWLGIGRGDDVNQPFRLAPGDLASGNALVAGGDRRFGLVWRGGAPPFSLEIVGPHGQLISETGIYQRIVIFERPRRLVPGHLYRVLVRDARDMRAEGAFRTLPVDRTLLAARGETLALSEAGRLFEEGPNRLFDSLLLLSPFFHEDRATTAGWVLLTLTELPVQRQP
ncbi:MAG TPA: hypothetical protein VEX35_13575 [Allosphingosinicella sp.]|nr:hypothetical protein [Allosphingosinicella sp.]